MYRYDVMFLLHLVDIFVVSVLKDLTSPHADDECSNSSSVDNLTC